MVGQAEIIASPKSRVLEPHGRSVISWLCTVTSEWIASYALLQDSRSRSTLGFRGRWIEFNASVFVEIFGMLTLSSRSPTRSIVKLEYHESIIYITVDGFLTAVNRLSGQACIMIQTIIVWFDAIREFLSTKDIEKYLSSAVYFHSISVHITKQDVHCHMSEMA